MEAMRYPIKLNMENTNAMITSIRLKQGDSNVTFVLRIFRNGVNIFDANEIPSIVFNRPDGTSVVGECSVAEGQYTYKFLGNELQKAGQIRADVKFDIYTETESTTTFLFECSVDTLPDNVHGAGIYVNSLKDIKDYLDTTVTKLEQELEAFDIQQVLDAVNIVTEAKEEVEALMPTIEPLSEDVAGLKTTMGDTDISEVADDVTSAIVKLNEGTGFVGTAEEVEEAKTAGELKEGMQVIITDDNDPSVFNASAITYDNTTSGIESTSVQGAIDSLNSKLTNQTLANVDNDDILLKCTRQGNVIDIYLYAKRGFTVTAWTQSIANLGITLIHEVFIKDSQDKTSTNLFIRPNGAVCFNGSSVASGAIYVGAFLCE